jgi:hypothetical protein
LKPKLKKGNVVAITNDFDAFMRKNPNLKESNIVVKALRTICNDANNGVCHNPNLYLSNFRATLHKFVFWILLGSHIPLISLLFLEFMMPYAPYAEIIKYQICCYVLIYILEMAVQYKYAQFTRCFYNNWYDKILNFDLLTVSMIRNDTEQIKSLSNSHDLLEAVNTFTEVNANLSATLTSHTNMLSQKLDGLLNQQDKTKSINAENVLLSLDDSIIKYREMNVHFQAISENIRNSFESLTRLSQNKRDEINAINKNTELLLDLRERFKTYQSEAFKTELAHLQSITTSLENNATKAFLSIDTAVTQNFSRLETGYDKFFDMCRTLSESMSDKYEEKTASILTLLFNNMVTEFMTIRERTDRLSNVITETSNATKILCETVYDFTQYTMSPGFMERIVNYPNFSRKLKDAADKLISYQKLVELDDLAVTKKTSSGEEKPENSDKPEELKYKLDSTYKITSNMWNNKFIVSDVLDIKKIPDNESETILSLTNGEIVKFLDQVLDQIDENTHTKIVWYNIQYRNIIGWCISSKLKKYYE